MGARFVNIDRDTPMFLPPSLQDWLPEDHIVHFIIDAVETLELSNFRVNRTGSGSPQYPPSMMLSLLIYCYVTGRFSSREIEKATYSDIAVRYICGGDSHPDHDTICTFRRENRPLFIECFVKVLTLAGQLGVLKKVGSISVDGSKFNANASKHAAVSYKRAAQKIIQLESEVEALTKKAEGADNTPLEDGLSIPEEIQRREQRIEKLKEAREVIENRYQEEWEQKQAEYEEKMAERKKLEQTGKKPHGRKPQPPGKSPDDKQQYNFTDPESRIMKAGSGVHFEQAYNAQLAVDTEGSYLILGRDLSNDTNDKQQLANIVSKVENEIREVDAVLADNGFFSKTEIASVEADDGPIVYASIGKQKHGKSLADLEKHHEPDEPPDDADMMQVMDYRLKTKIGKEKYKLRKQTVEPVYGIIKEVLGFRRFLMRGLTKVQLEWDLVTLAYNFKRLFVLTGQGKLLKTMQSSLCIG